MSPINNNNNINSSSFPNPNAITIVSSINDSEMATVLVDNMSVSSSNAATTHECHKRTQSSASSATKQNIEMSVLDCTIIDEEEEPKIHHSTAPVLVPSNRKRGCTFPSAYTILFILSILVAISTYIIPAGTYDRVFDAKVGKDVPIPGTYREVLQYTYDIYIYILLCVCLYILHTYT